MYKKYYGFFIFLIIQVYKLVFLLNIKLEISQKLDFWFLILFDFNIFVMQPNFIIKNIAFWFYIYIMCLFLKILNILEIFPNFFYWFIKFC